MDSIPIKLQKRQSPQDYIDGYRAGLKAVKKYIEEQLESLDTVQEIHDKTN